MEDATRAHYWCYTCSRMVNPAMEAEMIKCPYCESEFVEQMGSMRPPNNNGIDLGSLAASILLGLMGGLAPPHSQLISQDQSNGNNSEEEEEETELGRELESLLGRRSSSSNFSGSNSRVVQESDDLPGRERWPSVVLFNPINQAALMLQGIRGLSRSSSIEASSSLGDFLAGPGLDIFLQHLAENIPGQSGTPPAQKAAVKALPKVIVQENTQCSVCLEDFPSGSEAKEMPCRHKFHGECILPWLEVHCSCPVCRSELPSDNSITETNVSRNSGDRGASDNAQDRNGERAGTEGRLLIPIPWSFDDMLTIMGSQNGESSSAEPSPATLTHHGDEN